MEQKYIQFDGPMSYANWLAHNAGQRAYSISEYTLFTDAYITGEVTQGLGPYQLLNTLAFGSPGMLNPGIVLRSSFYLRYVNPIFDKTDTSNYHGGWFTDEIAALISLSMGIRLKSGHESRRFDNMVNDPLGRPQAPKWGSDPVLIYTQTSHIIPSAAKSHCLNDELNPLQVLPYLTGKQAIGVIRAARLYQDALWIAESEPALAWVMFVSALEVGAGLSHRTGESAVSKLQAVKPKLFELLKATGDEGLLTQVADEIAQTLGSQKKFINFVLKFLPEPPDIRPHWSQVNWSPEQMQIHLKKIYDYRSRALHTGEPFPAPMCRGDNHIDGVLPERPTGLATSTMNGVWKLEDTPMLLHIFEYITRKVLLNWLTSLRPPQTST